MNWRRLSEVALVGIGAGGVIALAVFLNLVWIFAPTVSNDRLVLSITCAFGLTGAVLAMVIYIYSQSKR